MRSRLARRGVVISFVCVMLLAELVARSDWYWTADPTSSVGMLKVIERLTAERAPDPSVLFIGNSLMRDAVAPVVVAEAMGAPPSDVASLAIVGGRIADYLAFHDSLPDELRVADTVVIGVDPRDFFPGIEPSNRVRYLTGVGPRWREETWRTRADLMLGWAWRTWDARRVTRGYAESVLLGRQPKPFVDDLGRIIFNPDDTGATQGTDFAAGVAEQYAECAMSEVRLREFDDLVDRVERDGSSLVLINPLLNRDYLAAAESASPGCIGRVHDRVTERTGLAVHDIQITSTACAVLSDCFHDYGHTNRTGAIEFSRAIGSWLSGAAPPAAGQ